MPRRRVLRRQHRTGNWVNILFTAAAMAMMIAALTGTISVADKAHLHFRKE